MSNSEEVPRSVFGSSGSLAISAADVPWLRCMRCNGPARGRRLWDFGEGYASHLITSLSGAASERWCCMNSSTQRSHPSRAVEITPQSSASTNDFTSPKRQAADGLRCPHHALLILDLMPEIVILDRGQALHSGQRCSDFASRCFHVSPFAKASGDCLD